MPKVIQSINDWQRLRNSFPQKTTIGLVPTMGNLHSGHVSLCKQSQAENDLTVVSIFVNQPQFNQEADYLHYPRTLEADLARLQEHHIDYCFVPTAADIYPHGYRLRIQAPHAKNTLEGTYRPGHFDGMLTVVMKLFQIIQPHTTYFGEKDYEQYQLVQEMIQDFFLPIRLRPGKTIREQSQLPLSSRNQRLSPQEKLKAETFASLFHQQKPLETILKELNAAEIRVEYLEERQNRRFAAVYIGDVRLIDNYEIQP